MSRTVVFILAVLVLAPLAAPGQQKSVYESEEFLERYGERIAPPPIDFSQDLSRLTLAEVRLLRNELSARKGYLFRKADLRAYFQGRPWYQPVWWVKGMDFSLNAEESAFSERLLKIENELVKKNFVGTGADRRASIDNVVNLGQFDSAAAPLRAMLERQGFAIVPDRMSQLFEAYETNDYGLIPNFVTTDVFLQLFHTYFNHLLRRLEERHLAPALTALLKGLNADAAALVSSPDPAVRRAASRAQVMTAVPLKLLGGKPAKMTAAQNAVLKTELARIAAASGRGSEFLDAPLLDYTQFIPRGHYTRSKQLAAYFRAMMWLQTAPFMIDTDDGLAPAVLIARAIAFGPRSDALRRGHASIVEPLDWLAGDPDNLSLADLVAVVEKLGTADLAALLAPGSLAAIRVAVVARDVERIRAKAADPAVAAALARPRLFILPQRHSPDAEILQRLVHVAHDPAPRRPFPKALDVYAALGDTTARGILLGAYDEGRAWPAYTDTLDVLRAQFDAFTGWDANIYNTWLRGTSLVMSVDARCQPFMQTTAWRKRCLNTALAAYTALKHDFVLYAKQGLVAECGGLEPPPPPVTVGYVEPNIAFWKHCLDLLDRTAAVVTRIGRFDGDIKAKTDAMREAAGFLLKMSVKELRGENLSDKEFETIRLMGSTADELTRSIMGLEDWNGAEGPDRSIALVSDVFTNGDKCLQEAVGKGNSLYAIVEINGLLYLTRGAVYSYYEFIGPAADRLTDESWQRRLDAGDVPPVPVWMNDIIINAPPIEPAEGSAYSSGC